MQNDDDKKKTRLVISIPLYERLKEESRNSRTNKCEILDKALQMLFDKLDHDRKDMNRATLRAIGSNK